MGLFDFINHLFNFVLPALSLALVLAVLLRLPLFSRLVTRVETPWYRPVVRNFLVGVAALTIGLLVLGNDGKMATYLLLVAAVGCSQWWFSGR
jgi:hypothetical protein